MECHFKFIAPTCTPKPTHKNFPCRTGRNKLLIFTIVSSQLIKELSSKITSIIQRLFQWPKSPAYRNTPWLSDIAFKPIRSCTWVDCDTNSCRRAKQGDVVFSLFVCLFLTFYLHTQDHPCKLLMWVVVIIVSVIIISNWYKRKKQGKIILAQLSRGTFSWT